MKNKKVTVSVNPFLLLLFIGILGLTSLISCGSPNQRTTTFQQPSPPASTESPTKYPRLVELLQNQQWIEADQETANIISELERTARLRETGGFPESDRYFNLGSKASRISCDDFKEIDQIWMKYSQGKFGLGIQLKVWQQVGRPSANSTQTKAANTALWDRFGDSVGWRNGFRWLTYYDLKPTSTSSAGMLPYYGFWFGQSIANLNVDGVEGQLASLFLYLEKCGL